MTLIDLYNMALGRVAVNKFVQSANDVSKEAQACNLYYPSCLDRVLEDYPWPFATKMVELALVASCDDTPQPIWAAEWTYGYAVPADTIALRRVVPEGGDEISDPYPFRLIFNADNSSSRILTHVENATGEITFRQTDVSRFPATFSSALAWCLASEIVSPLSLSTKPFDKAVRGYHAALSVARAQQANIERPRKRDNIFLSVRA